MIRPPRPFLTSLDPRRRRVAAPAPALALAAALLASPAGAAEVVVRVAGIAGSAGEIGCALFRAGADFPLGVAGARQVWMKADAAGVTCRFDDVPEGTWAVSVAHDLNGNRRVDTNLVGLPTEAWGVSRNVRPTLRAPRFDEASFEVAAGRPVALEVTAAR